MKNNICVGCGKPIEKRNKRCRSCRTKFLWESGCFKMVPCARMGDKNPAWKGGRRIDPAGYVNILDHSHHRARQTGYVLEHIVVWELANNKIIPDGWIIHHLNGIKDDNRICNLVALPSKKHFHILAAKAKRIQELEALLNHSQPQLL